MIVPVVRRATRADAVITGLGEVDTVALNDRVLSCRENALVCTATDIVAIITVLLSWQARYLRYVQRIVHSQVLPRSRQVADLAHTRVIGQWGEHPSRLLLEALVLAVAEVHKACALRW